MLLAAALRFANHVLGQHGWARQRLLPFAGQRVRFEFGAFAVPLLIAGDGRLVSETGASDGAAPTVTLTLPPDAPLRALTDRASLFAAAHIAGSAELAETLAFVFRHLDWDVESDVAHFVGDIAAHRLVAGGRSIARWHQQQATNLALNLAEYFTEESPAIARRLDVSDFCAEAARLPEQLDRLAARVAALER